MKINGVYIGIMFSVLLCGCLSTRVDYEIKEIESRLEQMSANDTDGYGVIWKRAVDILRLHGGANNGVGAISWNNGRDNEVYVYWISLEPADGIVILIGNDGIAREAVNIDSRGILKSASCTLRQGVIIGDQEVVLSLRTGNSIKLGRPIILNRSTQQVDSAEASTIAVPPSNASGSPR